MNKIQSIWRCVLPAIGICILMTGCSNENEIESFNHYGTESDSAYYYFNLGWHEIMDNGRWTKSEEAFRKAMEFDPEWLLGKSMVGRITRDLREREQIVKDIRMNAQRAGEDERLLIDVNLFSLEATNNMAKGRPNPPDLLSLRQQLAERNFGTFVRKYPDDSYFKAEYIEFINRNYGPQVALDTLTVLATPEQRKLGFYLSYEGQLELDRQNLDRAIELCNALTPLMLDDSYLTQKVLRTRILLEQDSISKANDLIDEVISTDPNHLIAVSLRRQVIARVKDQSR